MDRTGGYGEEMAKEPAKWMLLRLDIMIGTAAI